MADSLEAGDFTEGTEVLRRVPDPLLIVAAEVAAVKAAAAVAALLRSCCNETVGQP